jgi:hypothetical protein
MSVDLLRIDQSNKRQRQEYDEVRRATLKNAMNSFTVPPINCSFCSETAIGVEVDTSRAKDQYGTRQVTTAVD